ncbi:hypothetical protein [Spiroplasma endosymbiont of Labia minor]|uniref:hypothetical protein n=1 Tax=Spiroplasma endosymbiont of Labia minor TaxID=3066305 RepID=UPI0030D54B12
MAFKTILLSFGLLSATANSGTAILDANIADNSMRNVLFDSIKNSSSIVEQKTQWTYDGQEFYSNNDLDNYIASTSKIETLETSSNPGKIISDYQYHILDNDKIYDTNMQNYQLIYRDAFGNVSLTKQSALDTYTNAGLVKPQYSYDSVNWWDSPQEAKDGFIYKGGLRKSLYYYINGKYYNVFSKTDQANLLSTLTQGYYIDANVFSANTEIYGTKDSLRQKIQANFENTWTSANTENKLNYANFLKYETDHKVYLTPANKKLIKVRNLTDNTEVVYDSSQTVILDDVDNSYNIAEFSKENTGWEKNKQCDDPACTISKFYYTKNFKINKKDYQLVYLPKGDSFFGNDSDFDWVNLTANETFNSTLSLYDNPLDQENKIQIYKWEDIPLNISGPAEIPTQYVREAYNIWFNIFYDQKFTNLDKVDENNIKCNDYGVHEDILYDVNGSQGYTYSTSESKKYYDGTLKSQILSGETSKNENGEVTYKLREDFYATKEELDNYLYLEGIVDTRLMYTYLDVQDISSVDGLALAPTEAEARQKEFEYESGILKKQFFAYDVFGHKIISGESAEDAVNQLQKTINLSGKYINKREIESWHNASHSYDDLIEDGIYNVYRIFSETKAEQGLDPYIYFDSYYYALEALKSDIGNLSAIQKNTVDVHTYVYVSKNKTRTYSFIDDKDIWKIVDDILNNE